MILLTSAVSTLPTKSGWSIIFRSSLFQGQAGKAEHLLGPGDIPVMQSDRGGQVTYRGPGQQIMYVMINLKRRKIGVRQLVTALEDTVIATLAHFGVEAAARADAPGVYVQGKKSVHWAYAFVTAARSMAWR